MGISMPVTDVYAGFIVECRRNWDDLCRRIEAGDVPAGVSAKLTVEVPAATIDHIRFDRIVAMASEGDD